MTIVNGVSGKYVYVEFNDYYNKNAESIYIKILQFSTKTKYFKYMESYIKNVTVF